MDQPDFEKVDAWTRLRVPAIDSILGHELKVLDDGFVRVVDYMGGDESIVQAARVSYGKGTKRIHEDRGLIRYLMRHRHTTPFEMCEIKLHVRVPMDCWRQWIRHRTANVNEYSTRYSVAIDAAQKTPADGWRLQSSGRKQGSEGNLSFKEGEKLSNEEAKFLKIARETYEKRLKKGIAREQARKDLPLSTYTEAYWKIDLHNLLHFTSLRMSTDAQHEIRQYANVIGKEIVQRWCPITWDAFVDYQIGAMTFSKAEIQIMRALINRNADEAIQLAITAGLLPGFPDELKPNRERTELLKKIHTFGLAAPWESKRHDSSTD